VALSLAGLELGSRLGARIGQRSDLMVGGAVLIVVGLVGGCAQRGLSAFTIAPCSPSAAS
jgi:hypothetical protein